MEDNLYDLIARESGRRGKPREEVLALALRAIATDRLMVRLPDGATLDTPLHHGGTWRGLIWGGVAAVERRPTFFAPWFRSIMVQPTLIRRWFDENWNGLTPRRGPVPRKLEKVIADMRAMLQNRLTREGLARMPGKVMAAKFGASRTTCGEARKVVLSESPRQG
jgi:hypothetical protein